MEVGQFSTGINSMAEIHWYEAHGMGKREFKIKCILKVLENA